jgi:CRP-like cAMP-binding protein
MSAGPGQKRAVSGATQWLATQWLLILAQLLALTTMLLGMQFLANTTGGTLFVFASLGPVLVGAGILILAGVLMQRFRKQHSLFEFETYDAGQVVFHQGDPGECAYFIKSGEVQVVRNGEDGETVLATLYRGQYFGEMALLANQPRNATVRALTQTQLAVLGKQNFLTMVTMVPATGEDILKTVQERAMRQAAR